MFFFQTILNSFQHCLWSIDRVSKSDGRNVENASGTIERRVGRGALLDGQPRVVEHRRCRAHEARVEEESRRRHFAPPLEFGRRRRRQRSSLNSVCFFVNFVRTSVHSIHHNFKKKLIMIDFKYYRTSLLYHVNNSTDLCVALQKHRNPVLDTFFRLWTMAGDIVRFFFSLIFFIYHFIIINFKEEIFCICSI